MSDIEYRQVLTEVAPSIPNSTAATVRAAMSLLCPEAFKAKHVSRLSYSQVLIVSLRSPTWLEILMSTLLRPRSYTSSTGGTSGYVFLFLLGRWPLATQHRSLGQRSVSPAFSCTWVYTMPKERSPRQGHSWRVSVLTHIPKTTS